MAGEKKEEKKEQVFYNLGELNKLAAEGRGDGESEELFDDLLGGDDEEHHQEEEHHEEEEKHHKEGEEEHHEEKGDETHEKVGVDKDGKTHEGESEEEHKENSRLGRMLKAALERNVLLEEQISEAPEVLAEEEDEEEGDEEKLLTRDDVLNLIRKEEETKIKKRDDYESSYNLTAVKAGMDTGLGDDDQNDVLGIMFDTPEFNKVITGNPKVDAEMNYQKAHIKWLQDKGPAPKEIPGKHEKGGKELKNGTQSKNGKQRVKHHQLDPAASRLAKKFKMSDKDIDDALAGPSLVRTDKGDLV